MGADPTSPIFIGIIFGGFLDKIKKMFEVFISIFSSGEANLARFVFFSQRVEIPVTGPRFLSKILVITPHPTTPPPVQPWKSNRPDRGCYCGVHMKVSARVLISCTQVICILLHYCGGQRIFPSTLRLFKFWWMCTCDVEK